MIARRYGALAVVTLVAFGISGCGDDQSRNASNGDSVDVSDVWARSSPAGVTSGAVYMTIESAADDELVGASVPTDVAATVVLHETVVGDGAAIMMQQVSAVDLPSGGAVAFEPGGLHMMLTDLAGPLESGSSFELTLTFADAEPQIVTVEIRDEAP
jgi:copper(I)-binding protein